MTMSVWDKFTQAELDLITRTTGKPIEHIGADKKMANEVKKGLEDVEKAVKELHPKEQSTLDKELDQFLNGGNDAKVAQAKEKFLNIKPNERITFQEKHPELFNAMFPKDEVPKPSNFDKLIAQVKADPSAVNKLPYNVKNYAYLLDPEAKKIIGDAMNFMNYAGVTDTGNPLFKGKYQGR
jgi:hypothetical protein